MNTWLMVAKEILHRKAIAMLMVLSTAIAAGCMVGAMSILRAHDLASREIMRSKQVQTAQEMAKLEESMRKAMLGLGFNVVILPKDQDLQEWHAQNFGGSTMPEEYAEKLSQAKLITIQHILPCLQEKVRWPEIKRSVILVGTRGEIPGVGEKNPMAQPVPEGTIVLGFELADSLGLKPGAAVTFMGKSLKVSNCYLMRGNQDDITAWINLREAQELLGKKGLINAIQAIECQCAWADLPKVREDIARVLPDTQVIERGSEALARAEARRKVSQEAAASLAREEENLVRMRGERERLAALLVPTVWVACGLWIGVLALTNVRQRRSEIALLRALGVAGRRVFAMVLLKAAIVGATGGIVGCLAGRVVLRLSGMGAGFEWSFVGFAMLTAIALSGLASWLPAMIAAQQEPATILRQE